MEKQRNCDSCGQPYEAKRKNSRFCGSTCRVRASRGAVITPLEAVRPVERTPDRQAKATQAELEAAKRLDTTLGAACMALAERIDEGNDTGSALASVIRELRVTLEAATKNATLAADPVDDLAHRRIAKLRGA